MSPIDWRELYAVNRAVIEGRNSLVDDADPSLASPPAETALQRLGGPQFGHDDRSRRGWTPLQARERRQAEPYASPAAGRWEQLAYTDGERRRPFFVYIPAGATATTAVPLVVMLHGCTQTAASFSVGSLMNQAADRHGFIVVYPEQTREANQQGCWNWFLPAHQTRGAGEPALIAGATRAVKATTSRWKIDGRRVFVAGMSAGGAMAVIMGATYPDLFAGVAVHSGLAYRCATSLPAAYAALARGGPDPAGQGRAALAAMGRFARPVPTIVVHGAADRTVSPVNGDQVVEQWIATNRLTAAARYEANFQRPSATWHGRVDHGHAYTRYRWVDRHGDPLQEYIKVEGLGHAWSGGAPNGSYTDWRGPSASEAIWDFFTEASTTGEAAA